MTTTCSITRDASAGTSRSPGRTTRNKTLSLGNDPTGKTVFVNGTGANRDSVGFPVRGWFYRTYTYADSNSDGIIVPGEVTVNPNFQYVGSSIPRRHLLGVERLRSVRSEDSHQCDVRLQGRLLDHQRHVLVPVRQQPGVPGSVESERVDSADRPRRSHSPRRIRRTSFGYLENGQFWRFRELSVTVNVPASVAAPRAARTARR